MGINHHLDAMAFALELLKHAKIAFAAPQKVWTHSSVHSRQRLEMPPALFLVWIIERRKCCKGTVVSQRPNFLSVSIYYIWG